MAAQIYNFQTYYTNKLEQLDADLQYYVSLDETPDEYSKPIVFRGLYQLAWDYFALKQDSEHNHVIYGTVPPPAPALDPDDVPDEIDTDIKMGQAMDLYCKNMGIVIGAKILFADNIDEVMEWVKDNGIFQATLPAANVNFIAANPVALAVAQPGAEAIYSYARDFYRGQPTLASNIKLQLLALLDTYSNTFFNGANTECMFFRRQLIPFNNAGGLDNAGTIAAYNNAEAAYVGNAALGLRFNGSMFLKNLLLTMTRNTAETRRTYNHVKQLMNSTSTSYSLVKEIESNIRPLNQVADVAPVKASEKTMGTFTGVGYNSIIDRLKTEMPRRLTHTCIQNCNEIYSTAPPVIRVMSYNKKVYVAPIQTRGDDTAQTGVGQVADAINTFEARAVARAAGLSPSLPYQAVYTAGNIDVLNRLNAMPGPNPQPLKKNKLNIISTDNPSPCTTNQWDLENMRMLSARNVSLTNVKGHGDWQSMPNYATCWLIKHNDKNVNYETSGVDLTTQASSTIKVFPFERKFPFSLASTGNKFTIPKDNDNCILPTHWEMFALWPTGKLIYRNMLSKEFTVQPPKGSYWKEWRGADYSASYMAEIGYQEAKAAYEDGIRANTQQPLTEIQQIELFQMGAHKKMEEFIATKNAIRLAGIAGVGGSVNNNKKRYNKKTMMSILKTAKRKYFTRRNNKKRSLY